MPKVDEVLKEGSIINVDITLEQGGYIADSSKMYSIGQISDEARRLVDTTYDALWKGIAQVRPGATLGDIGHAIQAHAEAAGYSVVREYCGHGIGQQMHEGPEVLHFGQRGLGMKLKPGMVFTIEPMINQGGRGTRELRDGWTVITRDHSLSAQWEHTVAVTEDGVEVLSCAKKSVTAEIAGQDPCIVLSRQSGHGRFVQVASESRQSSHADSPAAHRRMHPARSTAVSYHWSPE